MVELVLAMHLMGVRLPSLAPFFIYSSIQRNHCIYKHNTTKQLYMSREEVIFVKKFINKISKVRKSKGLKQKGLAELLNTKQQVISRYETNTEYPSLERLVEIAIALDVNLDELIEIQNMHKTLNEKD